MSQTSLYDDSTSFTACGFEILFAAISSKKIQALQAKLDGDLAQVMNEFDQHGFVKDGELDTQKITAALQSKTVDQEIERDLKMVLTGHYPLATRLSDEVCEFICDKDLVGAVSEATKLNMTKVHMPPMVRFIHPHNQSAGVPPHQDYAYNTHMTDFVTTWLPFVDIDESCGGVKIFPDYHKNAEAPFYPDFENNGVWLEGINVDEEKSVDCAPMKPGDVLIFNPHILHGSIPNRSDRIRFSMDIRYIPEGATSTKSYLNLHDLSRVVV